MLVHAVMACAPLGAVSYLLAASALTVGGIGPGAWRFLLWFSLIAMLAVAVPATLTGITERNHMYANWPPSHRAKLVLSIILAVMVASELVALGTDPRGLQIVTLLGFATVIGNCAVALALSYFGLRITLGRQGFGPTSYVPDMDCEPPLNILDAVAEHAHEPARLIDVQQEGIG